MKSVGLTFNQDALGLLIICLNQNFLEDAHVVHSLEAALTKKFRHFHVARVCKAWS